MPTMLVAKKTNFLPKKLSDCILIALEDLEAVERNPNIQVDMEEWCEVRGRGTSFTCHACFAGSAMVQRGLKKTPYDIKNLSTHFDPHNFSENAEIRLYALNEVRIGDVARALRTISSESGDARINKFEGLFRNFCLGSKNTYKKNPEGWKLAMQDIAGILAAEGF